MWILHSFLDVGGTKIPGGQVEVGPCLLISTLPPFSPSIPAAPRGACEGKSPILLTDGGSALCKPWNGMVLSY